MVEEDTVETETYDWAEIRELVDIIDLLRGHPNLKPISDAAMARLNAIANPPSEEGEDEVTTAENNPAPVDREEEDEDKEEEKKHV